VETDTSKDGDVFIEDDIAAYKDPEKQKQLLQSTLICSQTKRPYRIQSKELFFYLQNNLPIPRESLFARAPRRSREMMQVDIKSRQCDKCGKDIQSVYDNSLGRPVWCQECYGERFN